jgi:large subunit ribosomal protein L13
MMILNAADLRLGRMASFVAKQLLNGERVEIVNAEKAVISGRRDSILDGYRKWMRQRGLSNPKKGPYHFRRPDDLVRLTVRWMLPFDKPKGQKAYRRLRVYVGVPSHLSGKKFQTIDEASFEKLSTRRLVRIGEVSEYLGAKQW